MTTPNDSPDPVSVPPSQDGEPTTHTRCSFCGEERDDLTTSREVAICQDCRSKAIAGEAP